MRLGPITHVRWLWLVLLVGAALRLFAIDFGLPYPQARPDESVAVGIAMNVLGGDFNPRFFHWPSLIFYIFAALFGAASLVRLAFSGEGGLAPDAALVLARVFVALAGTATLLAVYRLGRNMAGRETGVIAAALLAVAILHVRDSHFAMTDVVMTLFVTASLAVLVRAESLSSFAAAGLLGGLAASTKYNAAAIVAAAGASQILWLARGRAALLQPRTWTPSLAFATMFTAGFLAGTPYSILDVDAFRTDLRYDVTHLSGGHGINLGRGWIYHATSSLPYGMGVLTFAAAVAGIVPLVRHHPRSAFVVGAFVLAFYGAIGSGYTVFFRYVLPLVPVLCVPAAIAVQHGATRVAAWSGISRGAALALLIGTVAGPSIVNCLWLDLLLSRTDTRVLAGEWLSARIEAGQSVHDAGHTYTRLELGGTRFHYWSFDPETNSFGHPEGRTPDWLVLTQSPLRPYARTPYALRRLAHERYELVHTVRATRGAAGTAVYDLQDAFFVPLSGFGTVERPGPTIQIYRLSPH